MLGRGRVPLCVVEAFTALSRDCLGSLCVLLAKVNEEYLGLKMSTFGSLLKDNVLTFSKMSTENGVNPPAPNPAHNLNFSLFLVLGRERLTGPNYMDWMRNLRFTLRYENKKCVLDEQIPTIDDDSTQKEIEAHQKHYDDANKAKASKERLVVVKSLMACKLKPGASICAFILEMKGYFDKLESLNMVFDAELSINIILSGLLADYN
ncbi:hypothetical protein Tco_1173683 [Tanacetum coccineum]